MLKGSIMKLNIIKLLITTFLFIGAAFAFELIVGHLAHADAFIDPQIRFKRGELGNIQLGGQELLVISIMIVPALIVYLGVFIDTLKK
ncbi:hypothetical protein [Arsenophonus apicola]|uniref:Uncharacterized protein n=1 Tax=Arsenophonus apicola TaxID=2879119 RepID=A0ABY8NYL0_9GAMM|nr:hypothetical protein [Arsenophonus apicola]WGO82337.1 hypothetical protein QG404_00965 [Arsenophonus apicola]WGO84490.1 hypothetical protein QG404_06315 [Arsenophonus apicola]